MGDCVALITARGSGEGVRNDSLRLVCGHPVIHYPVQAARESSHVTRLCLSTFSQELCDAVADLGVEAILRPPFLARPSSSHFDVVTHALKEITNGHGAPEYLVVILGNTVTFEVGIIDRCVDVLVHNPHVDTVVTVTEQNEYHPLRAKRLRLPIHDGAADDDGAPLFIEPFLDVVGKVSTNRQDLTSAYFLNFAVMALRVDTCFTGRGQWPHGFCGDTVVGVASDHCRELIEVEDVAFAEQWLRQRGRDQ